MSTFWKEFFFVDRLVGNGPDRSMQCGPALSTVYISSSKTSKNDVIMSVSIPIYPYRIGFFGYDRRIVFFFISVKLHSVVEPVIQFLKSRS